MHELHLPWMELSVLIPLIGAVCVKLIRDTDVMYRISVIVCLLTLACATGEWIDFGLMHTFEAHEHFDFLATLLHKEIFVIDELNAPLLPLAALLYLMTVLSTLRTKMNRFSFSATLVSESILLGILSCRHPLAIILLSSKRTRRGKQ